MQGDRETRPEGFDEDISDISISSPPCKCDDEDSTCECDGEDSECECIIQDDDERSYDGSDVDYYYDLKNEREERKRELRKERILYRKEKDEQRIIEADMENEILSTYESLKKAETERELSLLVTTACKRFNLYSADHVNHCYRTLYGSNYVEFCYLDQDDFLRITPERQLGQLTGHLYFNSNTDCDFAPFTHPKHASLEDYRVKSNDGKYELTFQFLSNDYLKLRVSRELAFMGYDSQPAHAPEFFDFVGICFRREREEAEREKRRAKERAQRSPSPREARFEMNRPMGWWNETRIDEGLKELWARKRKRV